MTIFRKRVTQVSFAFLFTAILYACLTSGSADGLVVGEPGLDGRRFDLAFTNCSSRAINCRMLGVQMKCGESWITHMPVDSLSEVGRRSQFPAAIPFTEQAPLPILVPAQGDASLCGNVPRHINSPPDSIAWRIAFEWSYAEPSRLEQWLSEVIRVITGDSRTRSPRTNVAVSIAVPL